MPTYRNDSNYTLCIDNKYYRPGAVFETYKIINKPNVVKLSDEPILPLALSETELQATTAGEELYVDIDLENCKRIEIVGVSTKIELRANVDSNTNNYTKTVYPGETVIISHDEEIERLYVKFLSPGSCRVIQYAG